MATNNSLNQVRDVQTFTGAGTWTKPNGVKFVYVVCIGAGGGGGSGASASTSGTYISGGAGGGGGAYAQKMFSASDLGTTESVDVGTGGNGANPNGFNSIGNTGTSGGN
jgi:hypothetical protein